MKLVRPNYYGRESRKFDIADAVSSVCTDSDHPDTISALRYDSQATAELLGRLVEQLHEAKVLSDDAVLAIVGSSFEKVV